MYIILIILVILAIGLSISARVPVSKIEGQVSEMHPEDLYLMMKRLGKRHKWSYYFLFLALIIQMYAGN